MLLYVLMIQQGKEEEKEEDDTLVKTMHFFLSKRKTIRIFKNNGMEYAWE